MKQMTLRRIVPNRRIALLLGLAVASLAGLMLLPPIPQDQSYHGFADQRTLLAIPNFWNVVSNLPFVLIGGAGLLKFRHDPIAAVLFSGIFLTGFGSAYYHWNPDDDTLFWDRLPMTLGFMAILSTVTEERVSARAGALLLWPLLATGIFSLLLWRWTGDLRLYAWAQFFPLLALLVLVLLFPPKFTGTPYWLVATGLYALAKLFEFYDHAIFSAGSLLSGHTLKHLASAAACLVIFWYFRTRRLI